MKRLSPHGPLRSIKGCLVGDLIGRDFGDGFEVFMVVDSSRDRSFDVMCVYSETPYHDERFGRTYSAGRTARYQHVSLVSRD